MCVPCRRQLAGSAFDALAVSERGNLRAGAAMLVHLMRPREFGLDIAAAVFAALAAPLAVGGATALAATDEAALHARTAFAHLGAIGDAMRCDGFPAAIAREWPDAIVLLAAAVVKGSSGVGSDGVGPAARCCDGRVCARSAAGDSVLTVAGCWVLPLSRFSIGAPLPRVSHEP